MELRWILTGGVVAALAAGLRYLSIATVKGPTVMPEIFLTCRADDGEDIAALLDRDLARRCGSEQIFCAGRTAHHELNLGNAFPTFYAARRYSLSRRIRRTTGDRAA